MKAIELDTVSKSYANGVLALDGVSLDVALGDFFGLLGPNGAGKSTTIGIITSLVNKSSGEVRICGYDLDKQRNAAKLHIGLVPQEFNFNIFEKVIEIVINQAGYYGVPRRLACERAGRYLTQLGLWEKRNHAARELSGGMKRRLMIARALLHEPRILILDEPTAGVDIELRRGMWEFLEELNSEGRTIVLTTHYLEEAEKLCRNIAIISEGKIIENTSKAELLNQLMQEAIVLDLESMPPESFTLDGYDWTPIDNQSIEVSFHREKGLNDLFNALSSANIRVRSFRNKANRLETLFLDKTAKNGGSRDVGR